MWVVFWVLEKRAEMIIAKCIRIQEAQSGACFATILHMVCNKLDMFCNKSASAKVDDYIM
jgi:hypothetical protein